MASRSTTVSWPSSPRTSSAPSRPAASRSPPERCSAGSATICRRRRAAERSVVAGDFRAGDPLEEGKGGGDDPERDGEPGEHDGVVLGAGRTEGVAELGPEEQLGGEEARAGRDDGDDDEGDGGVQGHDPAQDAEGGAGRGQEAEGTFAVVEPGDHADRQAAGGDDEAGEDGPVGQAP